MARVLTILMFVFGLLLASSGVGICVHASGRIASSQAFLPYMITGWVCLGVGLILALAMTKSAQLRERRLTAVCSTGERNDAEESPAPQPSVSFSARSGVE